MTTGRSALAAAFVCAAMAVTGTTAQRRSLDDLRARMLEALAAGRAPSIAVAIARDGRIIWSDGFGFADKARRTPSTAATPYGVASLTKTFTATALMVLSERGRLSLDDSISKHLGAVARPNGTAPSEVTIRRTLQNVAGFPLHYQWFYLDRPPRPPSIADTLRCYGTEVSPPGSRYLYSNLGYGVLGEVVARASGQPFGMFLEREIFQPLGLESARMPERPDDVDDAATPHGTDGEPLSFFLSDHPGASDLYVSAEDLARFGLFHLGALQPSRPVIGDESRTAMQQPGIGGYGFGWSVNPNWRGRRVIWNSGAKPGGAATLWLVPAERIVIALVSNQIGGPVNQFAGEILASLLNVDVPPAAAPPTPDESPGTKPAPPPPPADLPGRWRGSISACPKALDFSLDIRSPSDFSGELGSGGSQVAQSAAARGRRVSGTLKGDSDMGPSTFQFDLEIQGDRLEGPVIRRTPLGPRGNNAVTMWAVLTRVK